MMEGDGSGLLIVIVNYRTPELVVDCLASLAPEVADWPRVGVVVVDNDSQDGSALAMERAIIASGWSGWARVRRSRVNGGFAYGNNLAIRPAIAAPDVTDPGAEHRTLFWLLNPDTVVRPGAIGAILAFFADNALAGVVGTAIDDDQGRRWPFAFRFPSLLGETESALRLSLLTRLLGKHSAIRRMGSRPERVDWVSGASVVIRREVFETVGMLDEGYFLYFEETDYCRAVARSGWECWYVPDAVVLHISGQSTGVTGQGAAQRRVPAYWFASRRRYLIKNHGRSYAIVADAIMLLGLCLWRLRCLMKRCPHGGSPRFLRDFIIHSALFRGDVVANDRLTNSGSGTGTRATKPRRTGLLIM